jgi:hypothetical protein
MTSHVDRLYALAGSILALFLAWVGVAAAPWQAEQAPAATPTADPAAAMLAKYEQRLRQDAKLVQRVVERRARQRALAPAPPPTVRIVTAAPVATTKTS